MDIDLLIIGAGAAGLSAALGAWEAGCRSILIADRRSRPGGILEQCIHPGFGADLTGPEYAAALFSQLQNTNAELRMETEVLSVSENREAVLSSGAGLERVRFSHLILASGCRERPLGALNITGTRPEGVYTAGQAQEMMNLHDQDPGERILILGSGDLGMIVARRCVLRGKRVIAVVEKTEKYTGLARNYHGCIEAYEIPLWTRTTVTELHGTPGLEGVTVRSLDTNAERFVACDTLLLATGLIPEQTLVSGLGAPAWLHLAGNCNHVHDLVDSAAQEARTVGFEIIKRT